MPIERHLRVRNFEKFQHFNSKNLKHDPNPLWIKVYFALLADRKFYRLPDSYKFHIVGLFLLASQHDNRLPCDLDWIQHEIGATEKIDLAALLDSKFIEWVEPDGPSTPSVTAVLEKVRAEIAPETVKSFKPTKVANNEVSFDNRVEEKRVEERRVDGKTARKTRAPAELPVTAAMLQWAQENGIAVDFDAETAAMLDYHRGKGNLHLDWVSTWKTWMRNTKRFGGSYGRRESRAEADQRVTSAASDRLRARVAEATGGGVPSTADGRDAVDVSPEPRRLTDKSTE